MFERKFTLRHVIKNFPIFKQEMGLFEEHFNIPWRLKMFRNQKNLSASLMCGIRCVPDHPWIIDATVTFRLISVGEAQLQSKYVMVKLKSNYNSCTEDLCCWEDAIKHYMTDRTVIVECAVVIDGMGGIGKKRAIDFRKVEENLTDVVLKVGGQEFNVSKALLATFSPYFKVLFFGEFSESKKAKIDIEDVDPAYFQNFLEIIHGEPSIYAENVESMLKLADRFDVKVVKNRCEDFLMEIDGIDQKTKLRIADTYRSTVLRDYCLNSVSSLDDARDLLPADIRTLSDSTLICLFEKVISPN